MAVGDCLELMAALRPGSVDAIVTDPPYGCLHGSTGFANETNFAMFNAGRSTISVTRPTSISTW